MKKIIVLLILVSTNVMADQKIYQITPDGNKGTQWETTQYEDDSMNWKIAYGTPGKISKTKTLKFVDGEHDIIEKGFECYVTLEYANTGRPHLKHIRYKEAQCHYHGTSGFIKSSCYNKKSTPEKIMKVKDFEIFLVCD